MEPTKNRASGTNAPENGATGASHIAQDAKNLASDVVDRARTAAESRVSDTQQKSAGQIGQVAKVLRGASEDLGDSFAAPLIQRAASALDSMSGSVGGASLSDSIRATERFARREPLLFLGGTFALGLLAARFLRSTARRDEGGDDDLYDIDDEYLDQGPYGRARDGRAMRGYGMDSLNRRDTMPMGAMGGSSSGYTGGSTSGGGYGGGTSGGGYAGGASGSGYTGGSTGGSTGSTGGGMSGGGTSGGGYTGGAAGGGVTGGSTGSASGVTGGSTGSASGSVGGSATSGTAGQRSAGAGASVPPPLPSSPATPSTSTSGIGTDDLTTTPASGPGGTRRS